MKLIEIVEMKKKHIQRLSEQKGSKGETSIIDSQIDWVARPRGTKLKILLEVMKENGKDIKPSSFDAISLPSGVQANFENKDEVEKILPKMIFIEIKTANQQRVQPDFVGFFFALTENEIETSELLGDQYKVVLFNQITKEKLITSVSEIFSRAKSKTWQVSVQL